MSPKEENEKALKEIREVTDGALDGATLIEAVSILISQRDNARHCMEVFRKKLKELGHEYV